MYNKDKIKEQINTEDIYELLSDWGGEPEYTNFGIVSSTICHNPPNEGSRKLYYYNNSKLFHCYTGCEEPSFDIFQLLIKVAKIQWYKDYNLFNAMVWIAQRFGYEEEQEELKKEKLEDWEILNKYSKIEEATETGFNTIFKLPMYNNFILKNFNHNVGIYNWLKEGISQQVMDKAGICYYPGKEQIVIPHYDIKDNLIGIRGRTLSQEEGKLYGKYRPLKVNGILYNHPLGVNLYGLNWNKNNIKAMQKAIIVESEKSVLLYASYFGWENNITVATCGSSFSLFQVQALLDLGVKEIIIAFDRQYKDIGDDEWKSWTKKLLNISKKYSKYCNISFIFDTENLLDYKDSPLDKGKETFLKLFKERRDSNGKIY